VTLPKIRVIPAMVKDWTIDDRAGLAEGVVLMLDGRPAGRVEANGEITTGGLGPDIVEALANGNVDKIYLDGKLTAVAVRRPRRKR
jgi:hypothetical protein